MRLRLTLRSLLVQAAWNPTDLLGTGLAWAVGVDDEPTPPESNPTDGRSGGRSIDGPGGDPESARSPGRERWHFNSHPYLASVAMGALEAMRRAGSPAQERDRFRVALRGPLGAMGDSLVWAGSLPAALLLAGVLWMLGLPPLAAALLFLLVHNSLHLGLRWWGAGIGLRHGRSVALAFQRANLSGWGSRARTGVLLMAGVALGVLGVATVGGMDGPGGWMAAGLLVLGIGVWGGIRLPSRLAGGLLLAVIVLVFLLAPVLEGPA